MGRPAGDRDLDLPAAARQAADRSVVAPPAAGLPAAGSSVTGPSEFTFLGYDWETHNGSAPPVGNTNGNVGTFDPNNVSVGSELVLSLTQTQQGSQILSAGSEVMTKGTFSYGTFELTSRVVNVLSGSDSSGFLYGAFSTRPTPRPRLIWSR